MEGEDLGRGKTWGGGKTWEIQSCVAMSGRQRVDTRGWWPTKLYLLMSVQELKAREFARQHQYHSSFIMPGMD